MSNLPAHHQLSALLTDLTAALRCAGLWSEKTPSAQALSSPLPFCCDSLAFEQWLQFVFVPRLQHCIAHNHPLPERSAILPMAEETLSSRQGNKHIFTVLACIDDYINSQADT
ncbi:YqcC family protein [Aestuariibacter salexigens]|uniref:YqcC family protein n=1 Tax=Aestuariibacter salexigens TaxID=226010 RepID=UPI00040B4C27|nr:YqcC family protein [Aestuariibacter salexigens]